VPAARDMVEEDRMARIRQPMSNMVVEIKDAGMCEGWIQDLGELPLYRALKSEGKVRPCTNY
jgi:hypothetical protein